MLCAQPKRGVGRQGEGSLRREEKRREKEDWG